MTFTISALWIFLLKIFLLIVGITALAFVLGFAYIGFMLMRGPK